MSRIPAFIHAFTHLSSRVILTLIRLLWKKLQWLPDIIKLYLGLKNIMQFVANQGQQYEKDTQSQKVVQ